MTEDEMAGWHHQFNGHDIGQTLGDGKGQGGLAFCNPWGRKELDTTWQLNENRSLLSSAVNAGNCVFHVAAEFSAFYIVDIQIITFCDLLQSV